MHGLLSHNGGLQAEAEQLRAQLGISRRAEAELARKAVACEKTAASVVSCAAPCILFPLGFASLLPR